MDTPGGDGSGPTEGSEEPPDPESSICGGAVQVGRTALRRLTAPQYDRTVSDLLGVQTQLSASFSADDRVGPFRSNAVTRLSTLQVEQYVGAAEQLAAEAVEDLSGLVECDPADIGDEACGRQFVRTMGRRAYRRPLTEVDERELMEVFESGRAEADFAEGVRRVLETLLQSPFFLYHVEFGEAPEDEASGGEDRTVALSSYEVASRLSYFLWNSMPDEALFAAAEAGELLTTAGIEAQLDRMLADPRAVDTVADFHGQWLGTEAVDQLDKDPEYYPDFDPELARMMREETESFVRWVFEDGGAELKTLLTSNVTLTTEPRLLALYGASPGADHAPGEPIPLDPEQRAGLLTRAAVMAANAHSNQSSPIHRGQLVREGFLCHPLPPVPDNVDNEVPPPADDATTRETVLEHTTNPECAGCHSLIDPIGLGFEHYDGVGAFREQDSGFPVDATGELTSTKDIDGAFDGAVELAQRLAGSEQVQQCFAQQWFRYALGRMETAEDSCAMDVAHERFASSEQDTWALIRAIATSESFRFIRQ